MNMHWVEKAPDIQSERLSTLIRQLSFVDALVLVRRLGARPQISLEQSCREALSAHLKSRATEMGGLLIGRAFAADPEFPTTWSYFIHVETCVPSEEFRTSSVSLMMGTEVWDRARVHLGKRLVVGWYHSHPNLGAFFSGTDRRTQRHFFNRPYNVGLVMDPVREEEAWFVGPEAMPVLERPLAVNIRP